MSLKTSNISEFIAAIETGEIALPDMQREFVWTNAQIRDFVSALYKKHPVGMILLWKTNPSENVPITRIDDSTLEVSDYSELVIDGQQRLTSLFLVKNGQIFKGSKEKRIKLMFNPEIETFEIDSPSIRSEKSWFNVTDLIRETEYAFVERFKELGWEETKRLEMMKKLNEVRNIFVGERNTIPVFTIPSTMDYEEVADVFVNINSKGTRIKMTDLLLALLALKAGGEFRKGLREYIDELEAAGWDLDPAVLVRALVGVSAKQGKLSKFRVIAKNLTDKELTVHWGSVKKSIDHLLALMDQNLGIRSSDVLPSQVTIVPIVYYLSNKQSKFTETDTKELILWLLLSLFWGRYSGPTETRVEEDIKMIANSGSINGLFKNLKRQVGRLYIDTDRFAGRAKNSKLLSYVVARQNGAEDWWRGHKITTTDYEEHHIIPKSLLLRAGYDYALIDDVANLAFLTEKANRTISNKLPTDYLPTIDPAKLKKQFVPLQQDLWELDKFESFLTDRRDTIVSAVNSYLKSLGLDKYDR